MTSTNLNGNDEGTLAGLKLVPSTDTQYKMKDFKSDQDVRWCPGCGDYAVLAAFQSFLPQLGVPRENIVMVSGIGCSSRFPYYLSTYGMHSIHGRAPAIATGLATSRQDLSVWVITGDGDAMSIGGNHLIHTLRRNVNMNILMFNNRIYGLTKGQYSPTSETGKVTKSSPVGSLDHPFNPVSLALGAEASFVARTVDSDRKHLTSVLREAADQGAASFVESARTARSSTTTRSRRSRTRPRATPGCCAWSTASRSCSARTAVCSRASSGAWRSPRSPTPTATG